jgi:hypothetical protein
MLRLREILTARGVPTADIHEKVEFVSRIK